MGRTANGRQFELRIVIVITLNPGVNPLSPRVQRSHRAVYHDGNVFITDYEVSRLALECSCLLSMRLQCPVCRGNPQSELSKLVPTENTVGLDLVA